MQSLPLPKPEFLPPLALTLKGIILSTNDNDTRAIIAETQTGKEGLYKIGDIVEDAELIHISHNKVIFIRSNGQQETVFLTNKETKIDPIHEQEASWTLVVRKINDYAYLIDPQALIARIPSLAQFLDMLDMTAVFQQGLSVGCRIGKQSPQSIGHALGLHDNDIIISINEIPTTTTASRIAIYEAIKELPLKSIINVSLLRNNQEQIIQYTLESFERQQEPMSAIPGMPLPSSTTKTSRRENMMNLLSQDSESNSSVQQIKKRDRMTKFRGGR